jgi:uncharacterized protein
MKRNLILAALALLATLANAQDIAGDWQGTIKTGMGELRLVLHVAKNADGTLKALIDSPDQNARGVPIDSITCEANKVRFSSAALKASYEGTLKSGDSISGRWTQEQKLPLDFKKTTSPLKTVHRPAAPSDIDGKWEGALDTPQGKLRLVFHLQNTEDGLMATMDSPDQKLNGWPATSVIRKGSSIKIEMKQVSGYFQGKIGKDPNTISGDWSQGSATPLQFKRSKEESSNAQPKAEAPSN